MKTVESSYYFIGTDGQYEGAIMDSSGNGVEEQDQELEIPCEPLPVLVVDSVEQDEYGCIWGIVGEKRIELFFKTDDRTEFDEIVEGYREVKIDGGGYAEWEGNLLFCDASDIEA